MDERETTKQTLETALQMLEGAAGHMNGVNDYMQAALRLFTVDPPDTDFQRGYLEALKVFANEAMGFKHDDPLLWGDTAPSAEKPRKPQLKVIEGGASAVVGAPPETNR
jgi:hypothetical protein